MKNPLELLVLEPNGPRAPGAPHSLTAAPSSLLERAAIRRGLVCVLGLFMATRLVVWAATYTGALVEVRMYSELHPPINERENEIKALLADPQSQLSRDMRQRVHQFEPLLRWDAPHYASIIRDGYSYSKMPPGTPFDEAQFNIAFFPLYPLTCLLFVPLFGVNGAMIFVANAAALAGAALLYLWSRRRVGEAGALSGVAVLLTWPSACFYSYGYSESLNLALQIGLFWLLDQRRYGLAALLCGLATATRPTATMLVPVVALAYVLGSRVTWPRRLSTLALLGGLAAGGALLYAGYLTIRFGSPQVYYDNLRAGWIPPIEESQWPSYLRMSRVFDQFKYIGRAFREFPVGLFQLTHPMAWNMPTSIVLLLICLAAWPRVGPTFRPLLLIGPLIFIQRYLVSGWSNFGLESMGRYMMLATPAFVVLGSWLARDCSAGGRTAYFAAAMILQASWAFHFGMSEWAG